MDDTPKISQHAATIAQEENRQMGVPNVYSINRILHWELPNGELITKDPMTESDTESPKKLPTSLGAGYSGRGDIGQRAEEFLDGIGKDS